MEWIDSLEHTAERFADVLATGDLDAQVPACPDWTLADLGDHLRYVHAWATHAITDGTPDGSTPPAGPERESLVAGYREAADGLVAVLRRTAPDAPAWAFGPEKKAVFWRRRQAHEAAMHLYDALASQGREDDWEVTPEFAWDGVDEVAGLFYPRQVRLERTAPLPAPLRLRTTDLTGVEIVLQPEASGETATVELPAADLLLTLWGRRPADGAAATLLSAYAVTP